MNLLVTRLTSAFLLFVATLLVGTVPVYLYQRWLGRTDRKRDPKSRSSPHETILSANFYVQAITQIGGGILFFTVLVHMIPEVRNNFEKYLKTNHSIFATNSENNAKSIEDLSLPYLEIAICVGFFAIYLAEVLMHSLLDRRHAPSRRTSVRNDKTVGEVVGGVNNNKGFESPECQSSINTGSARDEDTEFDETSAIIDDQTRTHSHSQCNDEPMVIVVDHVCEETVEEEERMAVRLLHGLVIIASFSIHSVFDGISIGVRAESSEIWTMFIAIASHKLMIALIISVELYEKCHNFLLVVLNMSLFSIMSPLGVFIVIVFEKSMDTHSEVNPVVILLSAIASGTILYIVFFEILQKNRVNKLSPILQFIAMFIGFGLMFMITITLSED